MKTKESTVEIAEMAFKLMVTPFIKYPDDLEVNAYNQNGGVTLEVCPNMADIGKLIGKKSAMFVPLQNLLALIGKKHGQNFSLKPILPPKVGRTEFLPPFDPIDDWPEQETFKEFKTLLDLFMTNDYKVKQDYEKEADGKEWTIYQVIVPVSHKLPICMEQIGRYLSTVCYAWGKSRGRLIRCEGIEK